MSTYNASSFRTGALTAACLAALAAGSASASDAALARAMKQKQRQVEMFEQQFTNKYGADAWFVFQVAIFIPDVSQSLTSVATDRGVRNYAVNRVTRQLETKTFKLYGSRQAAEMLWNSVRSSFRYEYRVFRSELEAAAFYRSIQQ